MPSLTPVAPPVRGERISLQLLVEAVPDADSVGIILPGDGPVLDADLNYAVQAAEEAFAAALRGTRDVRSIEYRLIRVETDLPAPAPEPSEF